MHTKLDAWTIVILGLWNTRIFSPEWVAQCLLQVKECQLEFLIVNGETHLRYTSEELMLSPEPNRVVIGAKSVEEGVLRRMEEVGVRLLDLLSHTPLRGVGFNMGFGIEAPPQELLTFFNLSDSGALSQFGGELLQTSIQRSIQYENRTINVQFTLPQTGEMEVHLNFHQDVSNAKEAIQSLQGRIVSHQQIGYALLQGVYGLQLEEENRP